MGLMMVDQKNHWGITLYQSDETAQFVEEQSPLIAIYLVGGFNHLEKYGSQWEGLSHILWKIQNV